MSIIIINPGSGPVDGANLVEAERNVRQLIEDTGLGHCSFKGVGEPRGGRYTFEIQRGDRKAEVDMPGLTLDRVRYLGRDDQNIWRFPRLYVNGSSWVWCIAIDMLSDALAVSPPSNQTQ